MYCNPSEHVAVQAPGYPMIASPGLLMQNPRQSRVSFHDTRNEVRVVSLACLSDDLRRDIWYTPADIDSMRTEARDLCRYLRVNPQACPEEHTRGLELRISLERQCRKQMTVQGVVEAQRRSTDPTFLACLAQRCSVLPTEVALHQAQRDYSTVYVSAPPESVSAAPAPLPFPLDAQQESHAAFPLNDAPMFSTQPPSAAVSYEPFQQMQTQQQTQQLQQQLQQQQLPQYQQHAQQQYQQQQQQQPMQQQDEFDCFEPIPLSAPDQSMIVFEGNKRILHLFEDVHDRRVRRRLESYSAA